MIFKEFYAEAMKRGSRFQRSLESPGLARPSHTDNVLRAVVVAQQAQIEALQRGTDDLLTLLTANGVITSAGRRSVIEMMNLDAPTFGMPQEEEDEEFISVADIGQRVIQASGTQTFCVDVHPVMKATGLTLALQVKSDVGAQKIQEWARAQSIHFGSGKNIAGNRFFFAFDDLVAYFKAIDEAETVLEVADEDDFDVKWSDKKFDRWAQEFLSGSRGDWNNWHNAVQLFADCVQFEARSSAHFDEMVRYLNEKGLRYVHNAVDGLVTARVAREEMVSKGYIHDSAFDATLSRAPAFPSQSLGAEEREKLSRLNVWKTNFLMPLMMDALNIDVAVIEDAVVFTTEKALAFKSLSNLLAEKEISFTYQQGTVPSWIKVRIDVLVAAKAATFYDFNMPSSPEPEVCEPQPVIVQWSDGTAIGQVEQPENEKFWEWRARIKKASGIHFNLEHVKDVTKYVGEARTFEFMLIDVEVLRKFTQWLRLVSDQGSYSVVENSNKTWSLRIPNHVLCAAGYGVPMPDSSWHVEGQHDIPSNIQTPEASPLPVVKSDATPDTLVNRGVLALILQKLVPEANSEQIQASIDGFTKPLQSTHKIIDVHEAHRILWNATTKDDREITAWISSMEVK